MIDKTNPRFWAAFVKLPPEIQELARHKHRLWLEHPYHPSLHFKELVGGLWSVRINAKYRAIARRKDDLVLWIWIGPHGQYDRLIQN